MEDTLICKSNSMIMKGFGILLMLIHHLFFSPESRELYNDVIIHDVGIVNQIGLFSKLCVAVFVFISGYGLVVSTRKEMEPKDFYWRRFKKLYLNYWYIWLLFVPIGVFVFGRSFSEAYGDHAVLKAILDFFGLLKMFGFDSYNPTWWFYNCIILLYLLFPFLNRWLWRTPYFVVCLAAAIGLLGFVPGVNVIASYLLVFISGMLMARVPVKWIKETRWWQIMIVMAMLSAWRLIRTSPKHIVDSLLCIGMALFLYKVPLCKWLGVVFTELGKNSMNMFLIHTFIFYYWFREYIYITRNPLIIILSLLVSSYFISLVIEWTKKKLGFYNLLME